MISIFYFFIFLFFVVMFFPFYFLYKIRCFLFFKKNSRGETHVLEKLLVVLVVLVLVVFMR